MKKRNETALMRRKRRKIQWSVAMSVLAPDGNVGALAGLLGYAVVAALAVLQARDVPVQRQLTSHHVVLHISDSEHQYQT
jgi:hypothetical protein